MTETAATEREADWVTPIGEPAYDAIKEMVDALQVDWDRLEELREIAEDPDTKYSEWEEREEYEELRDAAGDCDDEDEAREAIEQDPLSLEVRTDWYTPGEVPAEPTEYLLLLGTGGPAVRIIGELDRGQAVSARLEVQDWFKPWTEYRETDSDVLLAYVEVFCFEY